MNSNFLYKLFLFSITTLFFLNITYSITYFPADDLFESSIIDVFDVGNYEYYINFNVDTLIGENLDYDIEILYKSENLVVNQDSFSCSSYCERNLQINKVFFGNYVVIIRTKYDGRYYEKNIKFKIDLQKENSELIMDDIYYVKNGDLKITGKIKTNSDTKFDYFFEIYPKSSPELKQEFQLTCLKNCNFDFDLLPPIIIDDYYVNIYSKLGDIQKIINVKYFKDEQKEIKVDLESDAIKNELVKRNKISTKLRNYTITNEVDLENFIGVERIMQTQLPQKKTIISRFLDSKNQIPNEFEIVEFYLNGSSENKIIDSNDLKDYKIGKDVVEIILPDNSNKRISLNPAIKTLEEKDFKDSVVRDISGKSYLKSDLDSHKLKPGIYSIEDNLGNTDYYAYGLISINTKKPLYNKNEIVEFIFVVLDKDGYLYPSGNITLNVLRPDGYIEILSVTDKSIISSNKEGVYYAYLNATQLGEYNLYSYTQVKGITVEVNSYVNVVEDYDFDILRDVPATIDPWQGPFLNNFSIIPKEGLENLIYEFYDYIPNSFDIFETNADNIYRENDNLVLLWTNLIGKSNPYYIANSPLITPYLYELGKANIISNQGFFYENRSWLFAIDPLLITSSTVTCSDIWGFSCGSVIDADNTFDTCSNAAGTRAYVIEATLSANQSFGGGSVDITCNFKPRNTGTEEYIYYYNGLTWSQIYSDNAPGTTAHEVTRSQILTNNPGTHWFRCIADQDGENDNCASAGTNRDNDDVSIEVLNSFLTLVSPQGKDYISNVILTNITTTINADISYSIDSKAFIDACSNCQSFESWEIYSMGTHDIEVIAVDSSTGDTNIWTEIFNVLSDTSNPSRNSSQKTCSDTFGFFCGTWPSTSEGDNTFDSCPSSVGGSADENVVEAYVNSSVAYTGDTVQVTCEFDPYSSGTEEYIYYYDGLTWTQLYSGNPTDGNVHNITVTRILSDNTGVHYFRCIADWDGENDECANVGSYYDNDDVSIDVTEYIELPFLLNIQEPQNITYTTNIIDLIFTTTKNATIKYKIDSSPYVTACTNCMNYSLTQLMHNGSHTMSVQAIDDLTSETITKLVVFYVDINYTTAPRNTSQRTCSDSFGFFCGTWPSTSESDNTFDTCSNSAGADEYVIEAYVNSSSVYVNDSVDITCEFDPYSNANEEYIYYYDTDSWIQLYSGAPLDSNIHNVTVRRQILDYEGTHWFRCIIDWDGENDECADGGSYYDNDDVSIEVIKPVVIPFILSINSPQATTYNYTDINIDVITTKNADISYSIDEGTYVDACFNCTTFSQDYIFTTGYHNITFNGIDVENSNIVSDFVEFFILLPISNETTSMLNLKLEPNITKLSDNFYNIRLNLKNLNSNKTPEDKDILVYTFIPNTYNISSLFVFSNSLWYTTITTSQTISNPIYNGTIYKFNITDTSPTNSILDAYLGTYNNDNSWFVSFNLSGIEIYEFRDLFLFGFK